MGWQRSLLSIQNDQELLHFASLFFDGGGLRLLNLVVELEFFSGLRRLSEPVVGNAETIVRLA